MTPTLLLTRPEGRNAAFADLVRASWSKPLAVVCSPLLAISFVAAQPPEADDLIFTSVNGVAAAVRLGLAKGQPAWCVGGRTARAAADAGFAERAGSGDAAGLVSEIIAARPGGRLAHIRGIHTRGDVAARLNKAGLICEDVIAYEQLVQNLSRDATTALSGVSPVVVPLFSPRTAIILLNHGPFKAPVHVVAMSHPVADAIASLSVARLVVAARPDAEAMASGVAALLDALVIN